MLRARSSRSVALQDPLDYEIVGRYRLGAELACGGTSTVRVGSLLGSAGFHRPVAIKRLHAQHARDPNYIAMLLDEARLVAQVRHANVVPVLDIVVCQGEIVLVMEYVHGQSLAELVAGGVRVPASVAAGIVGDTLRGLHAAHEASSVDGQRLGIVHRDVSPQNIIVGADGYTRITDFGIAKAEDRIQTTLTGQLKGKLSYMAPEQFSGDVVLDRRTDVWAASVVLWELLTHRRLFAADGRRCVVSAVLREAIPAPSTVAGSPAALDGIVLRGLSRDRELRYASADEMAEELRAALPADGPTAVGAWVKSAAASWLATCAEKLKGVHGGEQKRTSSGVGTVRARLVALGVDTFTPPQNERAPIARARPAEVTLVESHRARQTAPARRTS